MNIFFNLFSKKKEIELQSLTYGFNFFIPTFILIISSLFQNYELTAEIGIFIGFNIIFTQIFSANTRALIISKKNSIIQNFILFRTLISILILILNLIIIYIFEFIFVHLLFQLAVLIILQWLNELILTYFEIKNQNKKFKYYLFFTLFFLFFVVIDFIFIRNLFFIFLTFNFILFFFFFKFYFKIMKKTFFKKNLIKIIRTTLISPSFFSSLSISIANLIWRILIILFCGKVIAGVYFAGFAIGSLPGTFFNNTFGPSMIKKNISYENIIKLLKYFLIIILLIFLLYLPSIYEEVFINNFDTQLICTFISLVGSFFMVKGLYFRQHLIQRSIFQSQIFKFDVLYSMFVVLIVPLLFYIGGYKLIIFSFLIASIISFITYSLIYKFYSTKNLNQ